MRPDSGTGWIWPKIWHHETERDARLALEDQFWPDISEFRKANSEGTMRQLVTLATQQGKTPRQLAEEIIANAKNFDEAKQARGRRPRSSEAPGCVYPRYTLPL